MTTENPPPTGPKPPPPDAPPMSRAATLAALRALLARLPEADLRHAADQLSAAHVVLLDLAQLADAAADRLDGAAPPSADPATADLPVTLTDDRADRADLRRRLVTLAADLAELYMLARAWPPIRP